MLKKYLPIIIIASAFIGFVSYATVKTQEAENKKMVESNKPVEEIVENTANELTNKDDKKIDNFISDKEIPTTDIGTITPSPVVTQSPTVEVPIQEVIKTPQVIEEPITYTPKREVENERGDD